MLLAATLWISDGIESGLRGMSEASSSMGVFFPFTNAQWNELERQAMVFKYMMHSIPIPYDLLFPFISSPPSDPLGIKVSVFGIKLT